MDRVLLFRHSEVEDQYAGCCRGATNAELSPEGIRASARNARFIACEGVELVLTTGLSRTDRVGELVRALGVDHQVEPRFRERDFGEWEGRPWRELDREYPALRALMKRYEDFETPGGETHKLLVRRIAAAWDALLLRPVRQAAIIGHGFMNVALLCYIQGLPYGPIKQEKGGVSAITLEGGRVVSVGPNCAVSDDLSLSPLE